MIYVFIGDDSAYLKLQIQKNFVQTKVALEDTEFINFSGYEDLIQDVVADCASPSFMANKKIVIMDRCYFLSTSREKTPRGNDHDLPSLKRYIADPDPINDLYLLVNGTLAKNEITDSLKKKAKTVKFANPDDDELSQIVREKYQLKDIDIDDHAVRELVKRVKGNYSLLIQEISKLENVGKRITLQDVDSLVHRPLEDNIFNLSNYMFQGQLAAAVHLYRDLLRSGNEPYFLMTILASQIRFMAAVSFSLSRHNSEKEMAENLKANPYRVSQTKKLVGTRKPTFFYQILGKLFDLDRQFKLTNENLAKSLELFVVANCAK